MNTPKTFEPVVTEAMAEESGADYADLYLFDRLTEHPDFQRQLRAYAAEVARAMVGGEVASSEFDTQWEQGEAYGHNACRAATLSAIDEWEKNNG